MRVRRVIAALVLLLVATAPGGASAEELLAGPGDGPLGGLDLERLQRLLPRIAELLELTPAQRAEIALILVDELPRIRDLASRLAAARRDYWSSHDLGEFDEDEYRLFLASLASGETELRVASVRTLSRIWNVLDVEQQQRLIRLIRVLVDADGPRHGGGRMLP